MKTSSNYRQFMRSIDAGHGTQEVITDIKGDVLLQSIDANSGHYTGDGNPEFVGKNISDLPGEFQENEIYSDEDWIIEERIDGIE